MADSPKNTGGAQKHSHEDKKELQNDRLNAPGWAHLQRRNQKLSSLLEVATALTRERDLEKLLDLILEHSIRAVDADRGTIFIMSRDRTELLSKIAHGEQEVIRVPVGCGIAGTVAKTKAPLNIADVYQDQRFNPEVDRTTGYRTQSLLCIPMLGSKGEVVGVVQALNHKSGPFDREDQELLMAFGANAAAAIENANLYEEIERLFEGFVQASVTAIESRDPTTAGHSDRVAELSVELMEAAQRPAGHYQGKTFNRTELREMRYAALLHDFGKVGVREHVLIKSEKLHPHQLRLLEERFTQARQAAEIDMLRAHVQALTTHPDDLELKRKDIESQFRNRLCKLDEMLAFIKKCNLPTILHRDGFERLHEIGKEFFVDGENQKQALLPPQEVTLLSIGRGSLSPGERKEIESHVMHTYNFLNQIPWTKDLAGVPKIAQGHHEKLNGSGYPNGVWANEIPVQTRIMTIADIFDALTATDRPYKKAVPKNRALDILSDEAKRGALDQDLLSIFIEADIPEKALRPGTTPNP